MTMSSIPSTTPTDQQLADPHGVDEWTQRLMQNMKRMSLYEDYRRLVAKSVSSAEEHRKFLASRPS